MGYYITGDCHAHFEKLIWWQDSIKNLEKRI